MDITPIDGGEIFLKAWSVFPRNPAERENLRPASLRERSSTHMYLRTSAHNRSMRTSARYFHPRRADRDVSVQRLATQAPYPMRAHAHTSSPRPSRTCQPTRRRERAPPPAGPVRGRVLLRVGLCSAPLRRMCQSLGASTPPSRHSVTQHLRWWCASWNSSTKSCSVDAARPASDLPPQN